MTTNIRTCLYCDTPLRWSGAGRKPRYCSDNCKTKTQRIKKRFQKEGRQLQTYADLRAAVSETKAARAAVVSEKEAKLAQLSPFQRAVLEAKRYAKAARQEYLDQYGPGWTLELEAEFWRWCEGKTRWYRLSYGMDPDDPTLSSYDACLEDVHLMEAQEVARKELVANGGHPGEIAALSSGLDWWLPRDWRKHWSRKMNQPCAQTFPKGIPSEEHWFEIARRHFRPIDVVAQNAFQNALRRELAKTWNQPCLPASTAEPLVLGAWAPPVSETPAQPLEVAADVSETPASR